jgi:hypothetical protein
MSGMCNNEDMEYSLDWELKNQSMRDSDVLTSFIDGLVDSSRHVIKAVGVLAALAKIGKSSHGKGEWF